MFGFEYSSAIDESSLKLVLDEFFETSERPKILEVFTPSKLNDKILLDYFKFIR